MVSQGAAGSSAVAATIGALPGVLLGWTVAVEADSAATIGAAIGGGVGLAVWAACRTIAKDAPVPRTPRGERLFEDFRRYNQGRVHSQWRVLLNGRKRLPVPFKSHGQIAPPRSFSGSIRYRTNLAGAVDAAGTPGGGPRLLVIGLPGYGKTVALLDIAQHLADNHQDRFGTAVIFTLGSWQRDDHDLTRWMVRTLCGPTGPLPGAHDIVTEWIATGRIAPILDGLDEIIDADTRRHCVKAVNTFIHHATPETAIVVATRPAEYADISNRHSGRLAVNTAIELTPLPSSAVAARLRHAADNNQVGSLADLVEMSPTHHVAELLHIPLWLWLASSLDSSHAIKLREAKTANEAKAVLADAYLDRTIEDLNDQVRLGVAACRQALAAIAGFLADHRSPDTVTFRFEDLTPAKPSRKLSSIVGLKAGLAFGFTSGSTFGLVFDRAAGLGVGLVVGAGLGLIVALAASGRPTRSRLRWPGRHRAAKAVAFGLACGLVYGLVLSLAVGIPIGLGKGLAGGLGVGLAYALLGRDTVMTEEIDEGWIASKTSAAIHTIAFGFVGFLAGGLVFGLTGATVVIPVAGLIVGLTAGLAVWLNAGGWYLLLQRALRNRARGQGLLPEDPVRFVRATVDVGLLRQTGNGVQFRHRVVADRLVAEAPSPGLADLQTP